MRFPSGTSKGLESTEVLKVKGWKEINHAAMIRKKQVNVREAKGL